MELSDNKFNPSRRNAIQSVLGAAGLGMVGLPGFAAATELDSMHEPGKVKITKLETFLVKPRWLF